MSTDAPSGGDKPGLDLEAMKKMIHDTINEVLPKAVHARVTRTEESLAQVVKDELAKLAPKDQQKKPDDTASDGEKPTMKALQDQIANLHKSLQERDRKVQEAEQRAVQTRITAEVQGLFAKHLGAESLDLKPYVSHYLSQFVDKDGRTYHKSKDAYDVETLIPADEAVNEWFTKGALKSKVQQSKAAQMPQVGGQFRGQQIQQPQPGQRQVNPLLQAIAEGISDVRPEAAQQLMNDGLVLAQHAPGTNGSQK